MFDSFPVTLVINVLVFSAGLNVFVQASEKNDTTNVISNVTTNVIELGQVLKNDSKTNNSSGNGTVREVSTFLPTKVRPVFLEKACAQRSRVRSTCLDVGKRSKGDRSAFKKEIKLEEKDNQVQTYDFMYNMPHKWMKKGFVISHIKVVNKMESGKEGLVTMMVGGSLDKFTHLIMETQQGRGLIFQVQVYMSLAASAYKSQINSFSSYIKTLT